MYLAILAVLWGWNYGPLILSLTCFSTENRKFHVKGFFEGEIGAYPQYFGDWALAGW